MGNQIKNIELNDIHLAYRTSSGWNKIFDGLNIKIPSNRSLGILGRNGAGKSSLINIICGLTEPDKGTIKHNGLRLSWPIGRAGFQSNLSAVNNIKFVCRLLDANFEKTLNFVENFAGLGTYLTMPIKTYSAGMKSRLTFALCMAMDFDILIVDEGFNAGDARFTERMKNLFDEKRKSMSMICVSHNPAIIKKFCDYVAILNNGNLTIYEDIEEAIKIYQNI
jgi:capsular polysaccharide transport system ATP-binding protein